MKGGDLNTQLEALKRQFMDVVHELHARKLAIPAGALLAAIVAAVVLLPKGSSPPPAPPTATAPVVAPKVERVAQVSLIKPTSLDDDIPLTASSDPFGGSDGYSCKQVSSSPKAYDCIVSELTVRVLCEDDAGSGPCAEKEGASAATGAGASSETGGSGGGATPSTGGGDPSGEPAPKPKRKSTIYLVDVTIDGDEHNDVESGDELPSSRNALAIYAGTNDARNKAVFISGDNVTVTGVAVDPTFGSFSLRKGQSATLTDKDGAQHKLTLKSISKVTK